MDIDEYETLPTDNITTNMIAGGLAGIMEHVVMYPIDSVKTRMQSLTASKQAGMREVFTKMVTEEGYLRPIRGMMAVVMGAGLAHALYFSCYEFFRDVFQKRWHFNNNLAYASAGAITLIVRDGIMTPVETVKQRMQMRDSPYKSIADCISKMYANEGLVAFYRAYTTQIVMKVPFQSVHFLVYETGQNLWNPSRDYNPKVHIVSGAMAGGVAAALTTPLDVCKTLLNTQEGKPVSGLIGAIKTVYQLGGPLGFFKGLSARVVHQMPSTAICWTSYEFFKYFLKKKGDTAPDTKTKKFPSLPQTYYNVPVTASEPLE